MNLHKLYLVRIFFIKKKTCICLVIRASGYFVVSYGFLSYLHLSFVIIIAFRAEKWTSPSLTKIKIAQ